jgi:hypothetical protein
MSTEALWYSHFVGHVLAVLYRLSRHSAMSEGSNQKHWIRSVMYYTGHKRCSTPMSKLTEEQAQEMLKQLSEHYKQPVQPVSKYCESMRTWQRAMFDRADHLKDELFPGLNDYMTDRARAEAAHELYKSEMANPLSHPDKERGYALERLRGYIGAAEMVAIVGTMINKSSLLDRLIYLGEKLRPTRCPEHKGTWSGLEVGPYPEHGIAGNVCPHGCNLLGWIPESEAVDQLES